MPRYEMMPQIVKFDKPHGQTTGANGAPNACLVETHLDVVFDQM